MERDGVCRERGAREAIAFEDFAGRLGWDDYLRPHLEIAGGL